ncbi:MAG: hypothetical protein ED555_10830 [Allomuricauda sp.]|nr:MAG: hypothetical protein ED555_10830 [Allomuricauda sp.]
MTQFFEELKRRNVYKVATAYALTSWLLIQIANTIGPNLNLPDAVPATITKILIIGFPIALVLAWLYELTPNGFKLTKSSDRSADDGKKLGRRLNKGIIILLTLAVSLLLIDRFFFRGQNLFQEGQTASIAVLPFANFSPEVENGYMADGLTEQMLNELSNVSGLRVPARTSSFAFKDKNEDIRHIAEQLKVNYVLEGSVRFHQDKIRITVQLINAANGYHLWSNTYDENFEEIFEIQESISRKVVNELRVRLLPQEEEALSNRLTENSEAYKLYLRSREFSQLRDDPSLKRGIALLEEALALEPNFAEAHAELSFLYNQWHFYGSLDKKTRDAKSTFHIKRALELAPEKPEVIRANANYLRSIKGTFDQDSAKIIRELRKALQVKPNYVDGHYMLRSALTGAKQYRLADLQMKKTVELDPLNSFYVVQYAANLYLNKGKTKEGEALIDELLKRDSLDKSAIHLKSIILSSAPYGELAEVYKINHKSLRAAPNNRSILARSSRAALNLDLWPLAEKYIKTTQLRFAETNAIYTNVMDYHFFRRDYASAQELLQYLIEENWLDSNALNSKSAEIAFFSNQTDRALEIFETEFPNITDGSIFDETLTDLIGQHIVKYIAYLRKSGNIKKADSYASNLCAYYKNRIENDPIPDGYKDNLQLDCYYVADQKDAFLKFLEKVYFEKKNRQDLYSDLKAGRFLNFESDAEYQELFNKIEAETHRMREEVITYLKKEGDWNAEWDAELGLR